MAIFADSSSATIALKKIKGNYNKAEKYAVEQAGQLIAERLAQNTPVWQGKGPTEHARDHVVVSKFKDGGTEVGYDKTVSWYIHFVEFGTFKQKPQGFVQKTQNEVEQEVIELMENVIREALT